ncbi:MAG: hypothetical protein F6J90_24215 [Moorea sp. SIOASIH]|uniref:hypothetical protein n=1 Tax=Moorena sp. SIOASIH TaxID=2607817 RepID=UPI0013B5E1E4|nr:hypothetical protein [Moorena sp. SIOASIH]NEO39272.1 hypothetical protein [Moorena sp. SIOASIH]
MAFRLRDRFQPWPIGHAIAFNQPTFNQPTLAYWPRDRVQPTNQSSTNQPWPIGHAIAFNQPTNLQPTNLGLLATRSRSTNQPSTNQPSTNQPSTKPPKKRGIIDQLPRGSCLEEVIRKQRKILVPAVTDDEWECQCFRCCSKGE